jgi:hypothetical protein
MSAANLVSILKTVISEYGVPEEIASDQRSRCMSEEYKAFTREFGMKIVQPSLIHPQPNRFLEAMVKTVKQLLERCKQTGSNPHLSLLLYRATPLQSGMPSPAELLNQRRYQPSLHIKERASPSNRSHHKQRPSMGRRSTTRAPEYRDLQQHEPVYTQVTPDKTDCAAAEADTPADVPNAAQPDVLLRLSRESRSPQKGSRTKDLECPCAVVWRRT